MVTPEHEAELRRIASSEDWSPPQRQDLADLLAEVDRLKGASAGELQRAQAAHKASAALQAALDRHAGWQLEYDIALVVNDRRRLVARIAHLEALAAGRAEEILRLSDELRETRATGAVP